MSAGELICVGDDQWVHPSDVRYLGPLEVRTGKDELVKGSLLRVEGVEEDIITQAHPGLVARRLNREENE